MLKLYFIRHGETLSNTWHTFQGWSDTPLTQKGVAQGKALGKGLQDTSFIKIYTSTSERAYDTACYAKGNRNIPMIMCKGLKEMNFGLLETKSNTFEGCETYQERILYPYDEYEGENIDDVCERMGKTLCSIVNENKENNGNIMCVSHGISILAILRYIDEEIYQSSLENIRFGNCSVTIVSWNNGVYRIEDINNMEFVEKGDSYEENNK